MIKIKEVVVGYEFNTYGDYKCSKIWSEDVKRRNVENLSLSEKIGCQKTQGHRFMIGFIWLKFGTVGGLLRALLFVCRMRSAWGICFQEIVNI
jgi:hypothetical protein